MSMNPGATVRPVASIVRAAVRPGNRPIATIFPAGSPTSPTYGRIAGTVDNASAANEQIEVLRRRQHAQLQQQHPSFIPRVYTGWREWRGCYSQRSATDGSTRAARRAGARHAASATTPRTAATAPNVVESVAATPYSTPCKTRVSAAAPHANRQAEDSQPGAAAHHDCSIRPVSAPSAMRIPNSRVRRVTR